MLSKDAEFNDYLHAHFGNTEVLEVAERICRTKKVFVFSGVIRDFFLGGEPRDLDIVLERLSYREIPTGYLRSKTYLINDFGGLKIKDNKINIDVWYLDDTWGIKQERKIATIDSLIKSAFFNFSAVAYDYREKHFVYGDDFKTFLKTRDIDLVYCKNPMPSLCIINTIRCIEKYNLGIGDNLRKWLIDNYKTYDYEALQISHFGSVLYRNEFVREFILEL